MRKTNECGVALTDVDEGDVQASVAPRRGQRPGLGKDPHGRGTRDSGRTRANRSRVRARRAASHRVPPPHRPCDYQGTVICCDPGPRRCGDSIRERRSSVYELRGPDEAAGAAMRDEPGQSCDAGRDQRRRDDEHAGDLRDAHQRDREKGQGEAGKGDP